MRRATPALLLSLAAHVALAMLSLQLVARGELAQRAIVDVEAVLLPVRPRVAAPPRTRPRLREREPSAAARALPSAPNAQTARDRGTAERRPAAVRETPPQPLQRPRAREPFSLSMRGLDLAARANALDPAPSAETSSPPPGRLLVQGPDARAARAAAARVAKARSRTRVTRRIKRWLERDRAGNNVRAGRVHPALYDVLRHAQYGYRPSVSIVPKRLRHRGREALRSYLAAAAAFNKMGSPVPGGRGWFSPNGRIKPLRMIEGNKIIDAAIDRAATEYAATVCIVARAGRAPRVVSLESSRLRALDRMARRAVERAIATRSMPKDLPTSRACYRFSVFVGTRIPRPSISCALSMMFGSSCMKPEVFHARARLVRVSYPEGYRTKRSTRPPRSPRKTSPPGR
ncbi:MAG: hypothetical protein KC503_25535 [Myxococcales bacterium]|nr:hypothetical protein [Myxococcales bacterium]